jgi:RNA polymerase sigma factor (sigma-70 family)
MQLTRLPPKVRTAEDLLLDFEQSGDAAPFEEIVRRYSAMVYGVCYRVTKNAHDAEDSTQAVFLKLALQARTTNGIPRVGPWLQRVAKTTALDLRRGRNRRSHREQVRAAMQSQETQNEAAPADDAARLEEVKSLLRSEVDELPPHYRTPLILYYFGGLSTDEIAKELGSNAKALAVRLFRGRQMLAGRLKERGVDANGDHGVMMKVALADAILAALADAVLVPAGAKAVQHSLTVTIGTQAATALANRISAITRACLAMPRGRRWMLGIVILLSFSSVAGSHTPIGDQPVVKTVGGWLQNAKKAFDLLSQRKQEGMSMAPAAVQSPSAAAPVEELAAESPAVLVKVPSLPVPVVVLAAAGSPSRIAPLLQQSATALVRGQSQNGMRTTSTGVQTSANRRSNSPQNGMSFGQVETSATHSLLAINASIDGGAARRPIGTSASDSNGSNGSTGSLVSLSMAPFPGAASAEPGPVFAVVAAPTSGTATINSAPIEMASPGIHGAAPINNSGLNDGTTSSGDPPNILPLIGDDLSPGTAAPILNDASGVPEPAGLGALGVIGLLLVRRPLRKKRQL